MEFDIKDIKLPLSMAVEPYDRCNSTNPAFHQCRLCHFETNLRVKLSAHMDTVHRHRQPLHDPARLLRGYKCKRCPFYTFSVVLLTHHSTKRCRGKFTRKPKGTVFQCPHCPYRTNFRQQMRMHNIWKHMDPLDVKWFECDHCPFRTKRNGHLRKHIASRHAEGKGGPKVVQVVACERCPYKTTHKGNYQRHMMSKHPDLVTVQWFICEHCGFRTKEKAILMKHILVKHTDPAEVVWVKCEHCPYRAVTRYTLKLHTMAKHADKVEVFRCEGCYYRAMDRGRLAEHVADKHPEGIKKPKNWNSKLRMKMLVCVYCAYSSKRSDNFRRHVMAKHKDLSVEECVKC